jgi:hypothetical protein
MHAAKVKPRRLSNCVDLDHQIMYQQLFFFLLASASFFAGAQSKIDSFKMLTDVKITIDAPPRLNKNRETVLVLYALPNGNTTEQTMGKKLLANDDWHYDIQHIKAQTVFVRSRLKENIIVAYLENSYKSWPLWKQKHAYKKEIQHIIDTLKGLCNPAFIYLNGHSGGGSFIFGYLEGVEKIPAIVRRINFLDSDYGYDSTYFPKLKNWLRENKKAALTVFAYNDSIALYNGKPVVSEKGGTWYRSHLMMRHFENDNRFSQTRNDSLLFYESSNWQIAFFFKTNPDRKIFHTQQVELNGFIHSMLYKTKKENEGYEYFGPRAYSRFIE